MATKPKLGSGARFAKLKSKLAAKGASNPGALAAFIGRKKFGKAKFQSLAAKGKKHRGMPSDIIKKMAEKGFSKKAPKTTLLRKKKRGAPSSDLYIHQDEPMGYRKAKKGTKKRNYSGKTLLKRGMKRLAGC